MASVQINEIYPNPESGSEWVELRTINDTGTTIDLLGYSLSDSNKQIYQFTAIDNNNQEFLVIEVSGLNNDQDSVVLRNETGTIIDSFSYTSTQKGLSWSRTASQGFVLSQTSKGTTNPEPTPSPTTTPSTTTTPSPNPTTTITPTPTTQNSPPSPTPDNTSISPPQRNIVSAAQSTKLPNYPVEQIRLQVIDKHQATYASRLVLIGNRSTQGQLQNAIMGSLLLFASGASLLYVKVKNTKPHS